MSDWNVSRIAEGEFATPEEESGESTTVRFVTELTEKFMKARGNLLFRFPG